MQASLGVFRWAGAHPRRFAPLVRRSSAAAGGDGFVAAAKALSAEAGRLAEYAASKGVDCPKARISAVFESGYTMTAAEKIEEGETVLRVPREVWHPFSAEEAIRIAEEQAPPFLERAKAVAEAMREQGSTAADNLVPMSMLSIHLLFLASDRSGEWAAFTDFLPRHVDAPVHWPSDEIEYLRGTDAYGQAVERRAFVSALHGQLFPREDDRGPRIQLGQFAWAQSILLTRATSGGDRPFTLVPVLDCLNHSFAANARVRYDAEEGAFLVEATAPVEQGDEVRIDYGPRDSATYLRQYGFMPTENPHAAVRVLPLFLPGVRAGQCSANVLDPALGDADPLTRTKRDLLMRRGWSAASRVPVSAEGGLSALTEFCKLLCLSEEDLSGADASDPGFVASLQRPALLDHAFSCAFASVCARIAEYGSTLQETAQLLEQTNAGGDAAMKELTKAVQAGCAPEELAEKQEALRRVRRRFSGLMLRLEEQIQLQEGLLTMQEEQESAGRRIAPEHLRAIQEMFGESGDSDATPR